jgi:hypothetical protein
MAVLKPVAAQRAEYGPRLGIAFSTVSIEADAEGLNSGHVTGYVAGGFVRFRPGQLGVLAELLYVRKGASLAGTAPTDDANSQLQLSYIDIPLLLVLPMAAKPPASVFVYGGPTLSIEADCRVTLAAVTAPDTSNCDQERLDLFDRRIDVGATFGGGVRLRSRAGAIYADVRYTLGFINLNEESGNKMRNRSAALILGYAIRAGS